ncbi:hypothetical protein B9479_003939 [Cryptococcus floricola]|uniref:Uncharacterized protein n=1 Tax=Cryptococcus floricola TaxID=2591691 RepID=A0A5D3AVB2_9TREE|nr:hypothetical protein B9479_003939 [Cryptococcus floricola]
MFRTKKNERSPSEEQSYLDTVFAKLGKGRILGEDRIRPTTTATAPAPTPASPTTQRHPTTPTRPATARGSHTPQATDQSQHRHRLFSTLPSWAQHPVQTSFHFPNRAHPTAVPVSSPAPRQKGPGSRHAHVSFTPSTRPEPPSVATPAKESSGTGTKEGEREGRRHRSATIPGTTRPAGVPAPGEVRTHHRATSHDRGDKVKKAG